MGSSNSRKVSSQALLHDECVIFEGSSFFTRQTPPPSLPSPDEVRRGAARNSGRGKYNHVNPPPVCFEQLGLLVKFGYRITIAEGQCLWTIRHLLREEVPVPEVYGWCRDGDETFIYMKFVHGDTLQDRWDELSLDEKTALCEELKAIMQALRGLEQDPSEPKFIGHIGKQPLQDIIFEQGCRPPGPPGTFPSVQAFHDWFTRIKVPADTPIYPERKLLPDEVPIVFTHGDLHRSNILISPKGQSETHVVALVDWHQSGWLPAYWEFCKALVTTPIGCDWETEYLPKVLSPCAEYAGFEYFVRRLGM